MWRRRRFRGNAGAGAMCAPPTDRRKWPRLRQRASVVRSRHCCFMTSTRSRPMMASGPMPACCMSRDQLAQVLSLIWRALKPGGIFYASFKEGEEGGRDKLNRYYNYPSPEWLRDTYARPAAGVHWRSRVAKSEDLTTNGLRCCSSSRGDKTSLQYILTENPGRVRSAPIRAKMWLISYSIIKRIPLELRPCYRRRLRRECSGNVGLGMP